jgi:hypothetical protein
MKPPSIALRPSVPEAFSMIRFTPVALAVLTLAAAPALAQTTRPQAPVQRTTPPQITPPAAPAASPAPGSEEWLRLRGETYRAAPEAEQDPAEVAETSRLNAAIVCPSLIYP